MKPSRNFVQLLKKAPSFYFGYKGSINRWQFVVGYASMLFFYAMVFVMPSLSADTLQVGFGLKHTIMLIVFAESAFVLSLKRLRDCNRSGWWLLMYFVPVFNFLFFLYLIFKGSALSSSLKFQARLPSSYKDVA